MWCRKLIFLSHNCYDSIKKHKKHKKHEKHEKVYKKLNILTEDVRQKNNHQLLTKLKQQPNQPTRMSSFVTIIPTRPAAAAPTRTTVWTKKAGGRSLMDFLTKDKAERKAQRTTSRHKTNPFEVFNMEESAAAPTKPASKTWKRAPLGKWGKASAMVKQDAIFTEKPKPPVKKETTDNTDYRQQKRENYLRRKFMWEEQQRKERKQKRLRFAAERKARAEERLRQQFEAAKIQVEEPQDETDEESDDDTGYDLALQCDEEMRPTDDDLLKAKHLNRIQQVEAELAEARAELEEAKKQAKGSWADAGDIEDEELRVECLEEKLERLKNM